MNSTWNFLRTCCENSCNTSAGDSDPEHKVSSSYKANLIFFNSGLERKERLKLFKEAEGKWDYDKFKEIILREFELKHEITTQ